MSGFFNNINAIRDGEVLLSKDGHHLYHGVDGKWVEYSKTWEERCHDDNDDLWSRYATETLKDRPVSVVVFEKRKEYVYHEDTDTWEEKEWGLIDTARVASMTIAADLVPVGPLLEPVSVCSYMDFPVQGTSANVKRRK